MRLINSKWLAGMVGLFVLGLTVALGAALNEGEYHAAAQVPETEKNSSLVEFLFPEESSPIFLPVVMDPLRPPAVQLTSVWTVTTTGTYYPAFVPNSLMGLVSNGLNSLDTEAQVDIAWTVSGPCVDNLVFSQSVSVNPGIWYHTAPTVAPACTGIFSATALVNYTGRESVSYTLQTNFVVSPESVQRTTTEQGFDRGRLPTVSQMQTWWYNSPYWVYNLYLGGISLYFKNEPLDAAWVYQVAQQGWSFTLTWVGPQAPCSSYQNRMSSDPDVAYAQGRSEAEYALTAARRLGFLGETTIIYDMEAYWGATTSCRNTVKQFMRGWTQRLHELGVGSGGYGAGCSSYISDWATITPMPDQVWIAHWIRDYYNSSVTVLDAACVSNTLWANQQRIKQYAGDHLETWGGVGLTIDSNVFDTAVTYLPFSQTTLNANPAPATASQFASVSEPLVRDMGLLDTSHGWVLVENQLYLTADGGSTWQVAAPTANGSEILGVNFTSLLEGQVLVRTADENGEPTLLLVHTGDGGETWENTPFAANYPELAREVQAAFLDLTADGSGQAIVKLQSSSAFNRLRQFTTPDGGRTWREQPTVQITQERTNQPAWLGGEEITSMPGAEKAPQGAVQISFQNDTHGWAVVQEGSCAGEKLPRGQANTSPFVCYQSSRLMLTTDGGITWQDITPAR